MKVMHIFDKHNTAIKKIMAHCDIFFWTNIIAWKKNFCKLGDISFIGEKRPLLFLRTTMRTLAK
jgi:hypothetical protein